MRNQMLAFIFLVLLFNGVLGQLWGMERDPKDAISIANPNYNMLIPFTSQENEYINNEKNFKTQIGDAVVNCFPLEKICGTEEENREIKEIEMFGYVAKGDDRLKKNLFVPYPDDIQELIRKGEVFQYHAKNSHFKWHYEMNPNEMLQKNLEYNTVRPFHAIASSKLKIKVRMNGYETEFSAFEIAQKRKELEQKETAILDNYCDQRSNAWCRQESETVKRIKNIYGDNIRIVQGRNIHLAPEFDFFSPPENPKQQMKLHLTNLGDVSDNAYTYEEFINLDDASREKIEDKLKQKIADAHGCAKHEITITGYSKGSTNVAYETPTKSKNINYNNLDANMKQKFDQYESMEVHSIFFRPEFDINMFDEAGHKDFRSGGSTFNNIGGRTYKQPSGWIRMGLNVKGKYGDSSWLTPFGEGQPGLWARGYHGPGSSGGDSLKVASQIAQSQLRIGSVNAYGRGVYWSDDPNFGYDGKSNYNGKTYGVKLQVAVRPGGYSNNGGGNFHCPNPDDIRVYGILIR